MPDHFEHVRRRVDAGDIELLLRGLDQETVEDCLSAAGTRMQPCHIRGGPARLLAAQVRSAAHHRALSMIGLLLNPVIEAARDLLGERADEPSPDDLKQLRDPISAAFSADLFLLLLGFVAVSGMRASDAARTVLDELDPLPPTSLPAASAEELTHEDVEEPERTLFTTLDEALIRSIVAASNDTIGAFSRPDVRRLVDEVVRLNSTRHSSWFHVGYLDALDDGWSPDLPDAGMNEERRLWLVFGLLSGFARRQAWERITARAQDDWTTVQAVVADPSMGRSMTAPLLRALLDVSTRMSADVLTIRSEVGPFIGIHDTLLRVHEHARGLLSDQQVPEAQALWESLAEYPHSLLQHLGLDAPRRLVTCARAADDFPRAARLLKEVDVEALSDAELAVLHTERGLVAAEVRHVRYVRPGRDTNGEHITARLERGRPEFERALEIDQYEWRANLCLGVLALHEDGAGAATRLRLALSGMQDDQVLARTTLPDEVRFYAALARLRELEAGSDGPAFADMERACADQWHPPSTAVVEAAEVLDAYESPLLADWLNLAGDMMRSAAGLAPFVLGVIRAGDERVVDLARSLGRSGKVEPELRFELLTGVLGHVSGLTEEQQDGVLDEIDDLLHNLDDDDVARAFAVWLDSPTGRELLGPMEAQLEAVRIHRRLGQLDVARVSLMRLIYKALEDTSSAYSADDLISMLEELNPDPDVLEQLRSLAAPEQTSAEPLADDRPVHVVFVGGDERQSIHRESIESDLQERHGGAVSVTWVFPGWSSNWTRYAEDAEATFDDADALVLMHLVRTNLGRRLRRTSGEAGMPWVACTGHSKTALTRAIDEAVAVCRA